VRFELLSSVLLGQVLNLLVFAAAGAIYVWLVAGFAQAMGLVDVATPSHTGWVYGPASMWGWMLVPAAIPLALTVGFFIADRAKADDPTWKPVWGIRSDLSWWSNTPNALGAMFLGWLAAVPGMLYLAVTVLNLWRDHFAAVGTAYLQVQAFITAVAASTFGLLVQSTRKGQRDTPGSDSFWGQTLATFRTAVAPRVALGIALVGAVVTAASGMAYVLTDGSAAGPNDHVLPLIAAAILGGLFVLVGPNATSLHVFYRERLAKAYLNYGTDPENKTYDRAFTDLSGGPELLLCGTANVQDDDLIPTGRNGTPFLMSSKSVGMTDARLPGSGCSWTSQDYNARSGHQLTIAEAVAISGAAVAPVAGREARVRPYRALFAIANIRLGVWLPNPYWKEAGNRGRGRPQRAVLAADRFLNRPNGLTVIHEAFGTISAFYAWVYVTDGGHYDNLGILEALRRRPDDIIMLDGSGDAEDQFPTMGRAIATARMDQGITIRFDPEPMIRGDSSAPDRGSTQATAVYPDGHTCTIHYIKCVLPAGMPWDVSAYQLTHPGFPATSTSLEMYDEFDFEAYRQLGYELTAQAGLGPSFSKDTAPRRRRTLLKRWPVGRGQAGCGRS